MSEKLWASEGNFMVETGKWFSKKLLLLLLLSEMWGCKAHEFGRKLSGIFKDVPSCQQFPKSLLL